MVEVTYEDIVDELQEMNPQLVALAFEKVRNKKLTALATELASQLEAQTRDPDGESE
jgi:hypothetical protein